MAATRSSFRALLTGLVLATVALLFGAAATAGAAPYPPAPSSQPSLWIDGDTVRACGAAGAADAGASLTLMIDGNVVATGVAGADGSFCLSAPIPAGLAPGLHGASFTGTKGSSPFTLNANFLVPQSGAPATSAPAGPSLPRTGTDSGALARAAIVLLAAGITMVGIGTARRRKNAEA